MVNTDNVYDFVDPDLLSGFTAQGFGIIGSVLIGGTSLQQTGDLSDLATNDGYWYFGPGYPGEAVPSLYVTMPGFDEPGMFDINIGVVYGFSHDDFISDTGQFYDGRLAAIPSVGVERDPLVWGRLAFDTRDISLINGDGVFDQFGELNDIYGNGVRIYYGHDGIPFNDYLHLYTGYIDGISIGEERVTVKISDKRKQLSRPIQYTCNDINALDAIEEILLESYGIPYNALFYVLDEWETAKAKAPNITMDMQQPESTINVIQEICGTAFGIFIINATGQYSFKIIDETDPAIVDIDKIDILNQHKIEYNPSEVLSSVRIGYNKDWPGNSYDYYVDTSREDEIFRKYKTYNQRDFNTLLKTLGEAETFADKIMDYVESVRGSLSIDVPMEYYYLQIGDIINVEIMRETVSMLGWYKCEIVGKRWDLNNNLISFDLRFIREVIFLVDESGNYIVTEDGYKIVV